MALVFIGLGSNVGAGRVNLREAWRRLGGLTGVTTLILSQPYRSEPVGIASEQWFTNAVGVCETKLSPHELLALLLQTEQSMGRDRTQGKDRVIDLDILYYNDVVISEPELVIPHPELANRLFVLAPLAELAPDHLHPVSQATTLVMRQRVLGQAVDQISWE
ncbi:MAG: 2-amino-4-hydroxy-6-hydroxymethyldihydropteridine diphosphokinase [Proteobacteria bacterium]|nr:2-amino-4-hydroxy-6-hydroxymethyldihydropteridine diphosphokinase [Desulfobulbaceae bacterium]MBU4152781.1 2-amino-4-hydroxy-6-hydroxymethyldihydropteridine diphosphokinase [Pseudomonadota bacterium]